MLYCKHWKPEKPLFCETRFSALQTFICSHQHHLAVSFTHVLQILTTVFTLSAWINRACGQLPSKLIPPHLQTWGLSWGSLLPRLSCWYKGLLLSVYLRPNFRTSVCERVVQGGKKTTHRGKTYLFILGGFLFTHIQPLIFINFFSLMWITWSWLTRIKNNGFCVFTESYGGLRWTG